MPTPNIYLVLPYQTNRAAEGIAKCEHALVLDRNLAARIL